MAQGEVKIVDEFTGRTLDGRRWSDGLHQAVEAKERVRIKEENHTWATVTLQNYFRLYEKLSGMTGTAETEASEFANTYELPVVPIPPNKPLIRQDNPDLIYKSGGRQVRRGGGRHRRAPRAGPAGAGGHGVGVQVRAPLPSPGEEGHPPRGAQRQAALPGGRDRGPGRPGGRGDRGHQHGRPGRRHHPRGEPRGAGRSARPTARGLDLSTEEGPAALQATRGRVRGRPATRRPRRSARLGGLYVLGSERHESRRIDNQLRGRSGRQGDPGESRFFLSLEDDLMRLFATGAMNWVMGRALPDDVPIEAKMVTKAIERAQNTVEGRNAESRKDVLKYDDVMNEQRKVIYRRRAQIIEGEDLRDETIELLETTMTTRGGVVLPVGLPRGVGSAPGWSPRSPSTTRPSSWPTIWPEPPRWARSPRASSPRPSSSTPSGTRPSPGARRRPASWSADIMLQIIDQRWQDHLAEMDYLREGINLRAMGNQDPLVAYQREGFAMFGKLMDGISDDYLRYVFHVQVLSRAGAPSPISTGPTTSPPMTRSKGTVPSPPPSPCPSPAEVEEAAATAGLPGGNGASGTDHLAEDGETQLPIVKSEREKIGRNEPCWCGSGKKYKFCHGAN